MYRWFLRKSPGPIAGLGLLLFLVVPGLAQAAFLPEPGDVPTWTTYQPWRDEYRTDFATPAASWDTLRMYFETPLGDPYTRDFTPAEVAARIMYLTCNGTYQFQFMSGASYVGWSDLIETTEIVSPACISYPDGGAADDLTATYASGPGSGYTVYFSGIPGAEYYQIYEDGELIDTIPAGSGGPYSFETPGGSITIVAYDDDDDVIGHSDLRVPEIESPSSCDVCMMLEELLTCPGWDDVLGDLQAILYEAVGDALADFFGPVPNAPTKGDIENMIVPSAMPEMDLTFPGDDLMPVVPDDYDDGPLDFDITDGPQIVIEDDSEPFVILEPDAYIDADDPGVMVFPGDERNTSGGIKNPDEWESPYPMPTPSGYEPPDDPDDPEEPGPDITPNPIPTPSYMGGDMPIPGG